MEEHKKLYELADEIIEGLPQNDRETVIAYFDNVFVIKSDEDMIIYCIGILKALGVL